MPVERQFQDATVLVTGAANGMGAACARRFAAEGASVVMTDVIAGAGRALAEEITASGGTVRFIEADLLDEAATRALVPAAVSELGRLDVAVLAAGIPTSRYRSGGPDPRVPGADPLQTFLDSPIEDWDEVVGVNVRSGYIVMQEAARAMVAGGRGSIVVITSVAAANQTLSGSVPYSVSKAGAWAMVKHVARLVAPHGVRVNAVGPGLIETNMSRGFLADERNRGAVEAAIPLRRAGTVDEIADAVLFLAGDQASFITGESLYVDGGQFTG